MNTFSSIQSKKVQEPNRQPFPKREAFENLNVQQHVKDLIDLAKDAKSGCKWSKIALKAIYAEMHNIKEDEEVEEFLKNEGIKTPFN